MRGGGGRTAAALSRTKSVVTRPTLPTDDDDDDCNGSSSTNTANSVNHRKPNALSDSEGNPSSFLAGLQSAQDQIKRRGSRETPPEGWHESQDQNKPAPENHGDASRPLNGAFKKTFKARASLVVLSKKIERQSPEAQPRVVDTANTPASLLHRPASPNHCQTDSPAGVPAGDPTAAAPPPAAAAAAEDDPDSPEDAERKRAAVLVIQDTFRRKRYHRCLLRPALADRL